MGYLLAMPKEKSSKTLTDGSQANCMAYATWWWWRWFNKWNDKKKYFMRLKKLVKGMKQLFSIYINSKLIFIYFKFRIYINWFWNGLQLLLLVQQDTKFMSHEWKMELSCANLISISVTGQLTPKLVTWWFGRNTE